MLIRNKLILTKFSGKRDRGRQKEKILDGFANWLGKKSITEMIKKKLKIEMDKIHDRRCL
jgi:hypothetical protein